MSDGMVLMVGGLLAFASLGVRWGVQSDYIPTNEKDHDFGAWLAYCLSVVGLACSVLMFICFTLALIVPEQAARWSGPLVALTAGCIIGFLIDQRNARKKQ